MRTMTARTIPEETYSSPIESILASSKADSKLRAVSDDQIRGKTIRRMLWDEAALTFELECGQYLNIVAQIRSIWCSFDNIPIVAAPPRPNDEVLLTLDGHTIEWRRTELSQKYIGRPLARLWFGDGVVFIYAERAVLACHLIVSCDSEKPWLFWTETE